MPRRRPPLRHLTALLAIVVVGAWFAAGSPQVGAQTVRPIAVDPQSGLVDGQVVVVRSLVSGAWPADIAVSIEQCAQVSEAGCDASTAATAQTGADGSFRVPFTIRSSVRPGTGAVDCTTSPCYVVVADAARANYGSARIFLAAAAPLTPPTTAPSTPATASPPTTPVVTIPPGVTEPSAIVATTEIPAPGPCAPLPGADTTFGKYAPSTGPSDATFPVSGGWYQTNGCEDRLTLRFARTAGTPGFRSFAWPAALWCGILCPYTNVFTIDIPRATGLPTGTSIETPGLTYVKRVSFGSGAPIRLDTASSGDLPMRLRQTTTATSVELTVEFGPPTTTPEVPGPIPGVSTDLTVLGRQIGLPCDGTPTASGTTTSCTARGTPTGVAAEVTGTLDASGRVAVLSCTATPANVTVDVQAAAQEAAARCARLPYTGADVAASSGWAKGALAALPSGNQGVTGPVEVVKPLAERTESGSVRITLSGLPVQTECPVPGADTAGKFAAGASGTEIRLVAASGTKSGCADQVTLRYANTTRVVSYTAEYATAVSGSATTGPVTVDVTVPGSTTSGVTASGLLAKGTGRYVRGIQSSVLPNGQPVVRIVVDAARPFRVKSSADSTGFQLVFTFGETGARFPSRTSLSVTEPAIVGQQVGITWGIAGPYGTGTVRTGTVAPGSLGVGADVNAVAAMYLDPSRNVTGLRCTATTSAVDQPLSTVDARAFFGWCAAQNVTSAAVRAASTAWAQDAVGRAVVGKGWSAVVGPARLTVSAVVSMTAPGTQIGYTFTLAAG
ncbi:MAG: hypothetical protein WDA60_16810 [Acidimicrobiia bacterium]|jgi:hypothetical protein